MTTVHLRESSFGAAPINATQAEALEQVGRELASSSEWWGSDESDEESTTRSLIRCRRKPSGDWTVWVHNAVGVIGIGDLHLVVQPKIPMSHFIHLLEQGETLPRHGESPAALEAAPDLWKLVAHWYVAQLESVIRTGLINDYVHERAALPFARGSIQPRDTVRSYYAGRLALVCDFDEFGPDSPANRVLRAAASLVTASPGLPWKLRRRARVATKLLDDVGPLQSGDILAARTMRDRRLLHYRPALALAEQVLRHTGRTLAAGGHTVWTFLLPTPLAIERGIRNVLRQAFGAAVAPTATKTVTGVTGVTFNPDIYFPGIATADVKYKLAGDHWNRGDLYQAIAFATAFEVHHGAVFNFADRTPDIPMAAPGNLRIRQVPWNVTLSPAEAGHDFVGRVARWLSSAGSDESSGQSGTAMPALLAET